MSVSPPRPKGPPLNALRAFEAAARLGGFAMAAEELCVTPAAVSQHIKSLEEWSGAELFERRSQGVRLTEKGEKLREPFANAFDELGNAVRSLREAATDVSVNIAALPSVAQLWLPQKLRAIRASKPDIRISVTALETQPNLNREMFDLGLFMSSLEDGAGKTLIAEDEIYPVCAPEVASSLRSLDDLYDATWIYDATWVGDWDLWLGSLDQNRAAKPGPSYSLYSLALEEAKAGAGVLIGHNLLVAPLIQTGDLVAPFPQRARTNQALFLEEAQGTRASQRLSPIVQSLSVS